MGDVIVFLLEKYSGWALIAFVIVYLLVEFSLYIIKDLVVDDINKWMNKRKKDRKRRHGTRNPN